MIELGRPIRGLAAAVLLAAGVPAAGVAREAGPPPAAPSSSATDPAPPACAGPGRLVVVREARPFFERHLHPALREPGPRGLLWWQWVAIPSLLVLAIALGSILGWVTRRVLGHLASRTQTTWDDELLERIASPLTALWAIAIVTALHPWLLLDSAAAGVLQRVLRAATYLVVFWAGFRSVTVAFRAMTAAPWTRQNASLAGLLPLGRKMAKVILLAIGAVAVMNELGFQVASLLAGLGIGGIALALAAQKTVENLFGSVAIGVDQPFRIGDYVNVEGVQGNVETIGMRSTRIRTLDRTLVTIPNGKLADMRSETFAARDRIRLVANLGLSYATTAEQMRQVIRQLEAALRAHPKVHDEGIGVRFTDFRESALNVEVMAWFQTIDFAEFCAIRTDLYLEFMGVVERAGTSFAFPTRTVHVVSENGGAPEPR
jgi:MscS family membrane protein